MTREFQPKLVRKINQKLANLLIEDAQIVHFDQETTLFYEGHIPIVAYLLINQSIELIKNKKIVQEVHKLTIIGLEHLMYNKVSPYTATAKRGSTIIYLDKSSLLATKYKQLKT